MLSSLLSAVFDADPKGFANLPQDVTFRGEAASQQISRTIAELSRMYPSLRRGSGQTESHRFAFLVSRFDFDDHRYGHVPRLSLYASVLLDCFPDAEIAFVVTGAPKNQNGRWDDPKNLHLAENWITASATGSPLYPLGGMLDQRKADRIRFITPRGADSGETLADAYSFALESLFSFRPSHVFCPGGIYYPPPAAELLFPFFPIIRFAFKPTNRFSSHCDAVLENTPLEHPPLEPGRRVAVNLVGALTIASAHGASVPPDLPADATIGLTAIVGSRLTASLAKAPEVWLNGIAAILKRHPRFFWLLVGEQLPSARPTIDARLAPYVDNGQIRILPYVAGLEGYFERSDFMIQPFGQTGGGTAMLLGMQRGLPVVCFSDHDMSGNIGAGRGSATIEGGLADLDCYVSDPSARHRAGASARAECDELLAGARGDTPKFRTLIDIASRSFAARISAHPG